MLFKTGLTFCFSLPYAFLILSFPAILMYVFLKVILHCLILPLAKIIYLVVCQIPALNRELLRVVGEYHQA